MARARARLAARRVALHDQRPQALGGAVDRGGEAGRAGADDHEVVEGGSRRASAGRCARRPPVAWAGPGRCRRRGRPPGGRRRTPGQREQALRLGVAFDVEPAVRDQVAHEELLDLVGRRRAAPADDAQAHERRPERRLPVVEQVVEDGVEPLLRRVPGLQEVGVEQRLVDGADRRLGVGVRRQQHALRGGEQGDRLGQELQPRHARHPLVDQEEGHLLVAEPRTPQRGERLGTGRRAEDAVPLAVGAPQIARHGAQDGGVVVQRHDQRAWRAGGDGGHGARHHASATPVAGEGSSGSGGAAAASPRPARIPAARAAGAFSVLQDGHCIQAPPGRRCSWWGVGRSTGAEMMRPPPPLVNAAGHAGPSPPFPLH
jgi:hypothetical protein